MKDIVLYNHTIRLLATEIYDDRNLEFIQCSSRRVLKVSTSEALTYYVRWKGVPVIYNSILITLESYISVDMFFT